MDIILIKYVFDTKLIFIRYVINTRLILKKV